VGAGDGWDEDEESPESECSPEVPDDSPGSGDRIGSGDSLGSGRFEAAGDASCPGARAGAAGGAAFRTSGVADVAGGVGLEWLMVTTRSVHTAGFGLPVAAYALIAAMPIRARPSATGAGRQASAGRRVGDR